MKFSRRTMIVRKDSNMKTMMIVKTSRISIQEMEVESKQAVRRQHSTTHFSSSFKDSFPSKRIGK